MLNPHEKLEELCELSDSVREYINNEIYRVQDDSKEIEFTTQDLVNNSIEFIIKELRELGIFVELDPQDYIEEWSYAEGIIALRKFFDKDMFEVILLNTSKENVVFLQKIVQNIDLEISSFLYECIDIFSNRNIGENTLLENISRVIEYCYSTDDFKSYIEVMTNMVKLKKESVSNMEEFQLNIRFARMILDYLGKPFVEIFTSLKPDTNIANRYFNELVKHWLMPDRVGIYVKGLLADDLYKIKLEDNPYSLDYLKVYSYRNLDENYVICILTYYALRIYMKKLVMNSGIDHAEPLTSDQENIINVYKLLTLDHSGIYTPDVSIKLTINELIKYLDEDENTRVYSDQIKDIYLPILEKHNLVEYNV